MALINVFYNRRTLGAYKIDSQMAFVEECASQFEALLPPCIPATLGNFLSM